MFKLISKKLRFLKKMLESQVSTKQQSSATELASRLDLNIGKVKEKLGDSSDVIIRRFMINGIRMEYAAIIFIEGLADKTIINDNILQPLMNAENQNFKNRIDLDFVAENLLTVGGVQRVNTVEELIEAVLTGDTAIILEHSDTALFVNTKGWEKRSITEPDTEIVIKGPREGFTETLRINTSLVRRRIEHPALRFETMKIGKKTRTDICIAYLEGLTNPKLVAEVKRRLGRINIDGILASGFIEQFIEDAPYSPFMTVGYTERPDVCTAKLLEGRVAIFVDGTPVVNTVPYLMYEGFQSPDDYNFRPFFATSARWFRYLAFFVSILLPAVYVALASYHQELIPTPLLISMAAATEGTPFSALIEALGMGMVFELLREAGIRLPRPIGQAVSIVGALVIGEATVSAGLVGAPIVIVVAFTAISSFLVPVQVEAGLMLRVGLTILAGFLGAYGIIGGLIFVYIHLASLRSFGTPYLAPLAPLIPADFKDTIVSVPIWAMFKRPRNLGIQDPIRQKFKLMPQPEEQDE